MANCVTCKANCERAREHHVKTDCISYVSKDYPKPRTNYDYLIGKPPEELAAWLNDRQSKAWLYGVWSRDAWLDWLNQEVDE